MTATTTKAPTDVACMALYLEFCKPDYTYQIIITQPSIGLDGKRRKGRVMRRRMNSYQARKNWTFERLVGDLAPVNADKNAYEPIELQDAKERAATSMASVYPLLTQMAHQEYVMNRQPIMVEVSYAELEQIVASKTPAGLIRRIQRTRVAKGFGEELVTSTTPTAPTPTTV